MRVTALDQLFLVAVDLPGFGLSSWLETYSYRTIEEVLTEFAGEVFSGRDFSYIGHSFGGKFGIRLASQPCHRLTRLVLVDAGTDMGPGSTDVRRRLADWPVSFDDADELLTTYRGLYPHESDDVYGLRMADYMHCVNGRFELRRDPAFIEWVLTTDRDLESELLRSAWQGISIPAHVLRSQESRMLLPETVEWMASNISNCTTEVLAGVGHNVLSQDPSLVADRLMKLVRL